MMTTTTKQLWQLAKLPLAVSLASALVAPASAITFDIGEIEGSFDSSLSVGASWSTAKRDDKFIGNANGGKGYTQTGDDGRLNFKKGDSFSKIFKGLHDLELRYGDTGVFLRGKYWYDFKLHDQNLRHPDPEKRSISNKGRKEGAKTRGAELLDAFLFHNYMIGDQPGTVRLGKQVVSWGESTFIMNSINSINPIDVSAFRRPGAELKEGLIPVNMAFVSQSLTDRLSAEAFYQIGWKQTVVDNCGTFFSGADVAADGCNNGYHILNKQLTQGIVLPNAGALGLQASQEGLMLPRGKDKKAGDSGQWGMALRWMGDNTEYGAYFMNYHSRAPFVNTQNADAATLAWAVDPNALGGGIGLGGVHPLAPAAVLVGRGNYHLQYPEDIRLYGLSFSTTLPTGTAWQGEVSYRPNAPVQINTQDLTLMLTAGVANITGPADIPAYLARASQINRGYNRKEITQLQTTFTHFFDQVLGAGRATVIGEIGYAHVGGLESKYKTAYGRDAIFGSPKSIIPDNPSALVVHGWKGFVTKNSWGYRLRGQLDYSDAFAGVNLKPNLAFSHDVKGYGPNGLFNEGAKAASIGLDADYQHTYTAGLSYTNFFGGKYNTMKDRDFVSLTFGMNF